MPRSRARRALALTLAATVAVLVPTLMPAQAQADSVELSALVLDDGSRAPVVGATVELFDVEPWTDGAQVVQSGVTDGTGYFEFDVQDGRYWVRVTSTDYEEAVHGPVDVDRSISSDATFGEITLFPATGSLEGTVVDDRGRPLDCVNLQIYRSGQSGDDPSSDYAYTDGDGRWDAHGLPVGTYKIHASDGCDDERLPQWIGGGSSYADAAEHVVARNQLTSLGELVLTYGPQIFGTVTKQGTTTPLRDVNVVVRPSGDELDVIKSVTTKKDGSYLLRGVPAGTYDVSFTDALGEHDGATISVTLGEVNEMRNVALRPLPRGVDTNLLRGTVTGPDKKGVDGITVQVEDDDTGDQRTVRTRRDGTYTIEVPAGTYRIGFFDEGRPEERSEFIEEWFENAPTPRRAKLVTIGTKAVTVNAQLQKRGAIKGTASVPKGWSDRDIYFDVYDEDGEQVEGGRTAADGTYVIPFLAPGEYRVRFRGYVQDDDLGYGALVREFFNDRYTLDSAAVITVGDGQVVTGRNIAMGRAIPSTSAPKTSGTAKKGSTLSGTKGAWGLRKFVEYDYQWYRGTSKITGATKSTYKATSGDVGKQLKVCVTASYVYDEYDPGTACSSLTKKVVS